MKLPSVLIAAILSVTATACEFSNQTKNNNHTNPSANSLTLTRRVEEIVKNIEKGNVLESSHIGEAGVPSKQWANYELLKQYATEKELIALTDYKNDVVRCYAFQALSAKCSNEIYDILLNHLYDTSRVQTLRGCIGMREFVGDYFINVITPNRIEEGICKINSEQLRTLDSILVNQPHITLYAKSKALENTSTLAKNYARIKQLVKEEHNVAALQTLVKFRKQEDKELIAGFIINNDTQYGALRAIRYFPDDYFYPYVLKVFEKEWAEQYYDYPKWRICYQVLARYPNAKTLELFNKTINASDEFRREKLGAYLLIAIKKYPHPMFRGIENKIKLSEYSMDEVREELESQD